MKQWSVDAPHPGLEPNDNGLFADSARRAYLERLRDTPQACLWDFMNWRDQDATSSADEQR